MAALANRFNNNLRARAVIVGPHGTGKSTLLEHLVPQLGKVVWRPNRTDSLVAGPQPTCGRNAVWLSLRKSEAPYRSILASRSHWTTGGLLVLDGLEQLNRFQWAVLWMTIRISRMGLLATSHRESWCLPTLTRTYSDSRTLVQLVQLVTAQQSELPKSLVRELTNPGSLSRLSAAKSGNVREVFMQLYDACEESLFQKSPS